MKTLKLGFTDTIPPIENFFTVQLSKRYQVIRDDTNPDYLIFGDRNFGNNNVNYKNCIKIFFTGENQRPSDYLCHYAISFDHTDDARHYRLPLYVIYDFDAKARGGPNSDNSQRSVDDLANPREFCSFIVKNGGCKKRNDFFHKLSEYKRVASPGPLFNNMGYSLDLGGPRQVEDKMSFLPKYKFNMCFENVSYPGYTTEKLYDAFVGKTVPIYWGSPTVEMDFNPKAFLSWHDYHNDDDFLEAIKRLDQNEQAYLDMFFQPMFREGKDNKYMDIDKLLDWFGGKPYIINE